MNPRTLLSSALVAAVLVVPVLAANASPAFASSPSPARRDGTPAQVPTTPPAPAPAPAPVPTPSPTPSPVPTPSPAPAPRPIHS